MKADAAKITLDSLLGSGITFAACLPDSAFKELYKPLSENSQIDYVQVANEGDGVGVCMGAWLGGELVDRLGVGVDTEAGLNASNSLRSRSKSVIDCSKMCPKMSTSISAPCKTGTGTAGVFVRGKLGGAAEPVPVLAAGA